MWDFSFSDIWLKKKSFVRLKWCYIWDACDVIRCLVSFYKDSNGVCVNGRARFAGRKPLEKLMIAFSARNLIHRSSLHIFLAHSVGNHTIKKEGAES